MGSDAISPVSFITNLGAWFDSKLTIFLHILAEHVLHHIITCTSSGISKSTRLYSRHYKSPSSCQLQKVQQVLKTAAQLVYKEDSTVILLLLRQLHWLPVRMRVSFKILRLIFKAIYSKTWLRNRHQNTTSDQRLITGLPWATRS